jgi:hypothetical protein
MGIILELRIIETIELLEGMIIYALRPLPTPNNINE